MIDQDQEPTIPDPHALSAQIHRVSHGQERTILGAQLNQFRIDSPLGAGGMGEVYLARDTDLDRAVAIKVLANRFSGDQNQIARFQREARSVAKLDHPNIIRVFQVGRHEMSWGAMRYMAMEFVGGADLAAKIKNAKGQGLRDDEAARIALGVAEALAHAHDHGVVHRDIKPANILIRGADSAIKVVDFGLASEFNKETEDTGLTRPGTILGTPNYLPPEQANGINVDGRADVYSLGITLYEMLAGRTPFEGKSLFSVVHAHVFDDIEFPKAAFAERDPRLKVLVKEMCRKRAGDRLPLNKVIKELQSILNLTFDESHELVSIDFGPSSTPHIRKRQNAFVGREAQNQELEAALSEGARLITIVGAVGVGKSRFIEEVISEQAAKIRAGLRFAELGAASSAEEIHRAIALALGIQLKRKDSGEEIASALRLGGEFILVLNDVDLAISALGPMLTKWLGDAPTLRVVMTSREALRREDEREIRLPPLGFGGKSNEAVELFLDRARGARFNFALYQGDMARMQEIVALLDGIPLAIELAAARVSALSLQQLLDRLRESFDLLRSSKRGSSHHHDTMLDAIRWSWQLLEPIEQAAMAQLSVFRDGFFLEDVEEVLDLSVFGESVFALDVVESLADRNFLVIDEVPEILGEVRFRVYESIRQFAEDELKKGEFDDGLSTRHMSYFAQIGARLLAAVSIGGSIEEHAHLRLQSGNFEAAYKVALVAKDWQKATALAMALELHLAFRGPWHAREEILRQAWSLVPEEEVATRLDLKLALGSYFQDREDYSSLATVLDEIDSKLASLESISPSVSTTAEIFRADLAFKTGDRTKARAILEAARGNLEAKGEKTSEVRTSIARTYRESGVYFIFDNQYAKAEGAYREAERLFTEEGNHLNAARNLLNRASSLANLGRYREALESLKSARQVHQAYDNRRAIAKCNLEISTAYQYLGQPNKAVAWGAKAEEVYRSLGYAPGAAAAIMNRGSAYEASGDFDAALDCFEQAKVLYAFLNSAESTAAAEDSRGTVFFAQGKLDLALESYGKALAIWSEKGYDFQIGANKANTGMALEILGRSIEAIEHFNDALECFKKVGTTHGVTDTLLWRSASKMSLGDIDGSREDAQGAEKLLSQSGASNAVMINGLATLSWLYYLHKAEDKASEEVTRRHAEAKALFGKPSSGHDVERADSLYFRGLLAKTPA